VFSICLFGGTAEKYVTNLIMALYIAFLERPNMAAMTVRRK
jgi:hypothetical protein